MKLKRLTQHGEEWEYEKKFSELSLQISDLNEKEALFAFMDDLKL